MPQTAEQLKTMYRKLAMLHHPDVGGNTARMQAVNAEYERLFPKLKDTHTNMAGEMYEANSPSYERPEDFINIINILIRFENVLIEIIGKFIWVSGNTKPYKETLKDLRFRWHNVKTAWYLPPDGYRKKNSQQFTLDTLRQIYDSQTIENEPFVKIASA